MSDNTISVSNVYEGTEPQLVSRRGEARRAPGAPGHQGVPMADKYYSKAMCQTVTSAVTAASSPQTPKWTICSDISIDSRLKGAARRSGVDCRVAAVPQYLQSLTEGK